MAKQTLRSFGFGPVAVARRVSVPSAAPFIATGVRIAASLAFVVAVAVGTDRHRDERYRRLPGRRCDSGPRLTAYRWRWRSGPACIGLVLNGVFTGAERRAFRWHYAQSATERA